MGRSKFPGKPPKTATRKRIKVLGQPEAAQNDPVTVAENIYYGLSLFNETFGDNEKVRGKKKERVSRRGVRRRPSPSPSLSSSPSPITVHRCRCRCRCRWPPRSREIDEHRRRATHRVTSRLAARAYSPASVTASSNALGELGDTRADVLWRGVARGLTYRRRPDRGDRGTAGARRFRGPCRSAIHFSL